MGLAKLKEGRAVAPITFRTECGVCVMGSTVLLATDNSRHHGTKTPVKFVVPSTEEVAASFGTPLRSYGPSSCLSCLVLSLSPDQIFVTSFRSASNRLFVRSPVRLFIRN